MSISSSNSPFRSFLITIGPGLLVAATGVGAGDLGTAAFTGNKLGVTILWVVTLGAFLKFVLNEGLARWQLATGQTLLEGAVIRLGPVISFIFLPYLLLWSFFVGAALMSACGVAMHAILPIFDQASQGKILFGIIHSLIGVVLVLVGGFVLFEKVMNVCIIFMFFCVVLTAATVCENWADVVTGLLLPRIPQLGSGGLGWTMALMGGVGGTLTVLCYGYWMREKERTEASELRTCRIDLGFAYAATAIFGISMVIIGSTIQIEGTGASLIVDLADKLEVSLGTVGRWMFLIGAWGAIFSSLLGVWQSVPYIFADFWGLIQGKDRDPTYATEVDTKSLPYRGYLFAIAIVPMVGLFFGFKQVQKVYAIFGAMFMPFLAVVLLILNGRSVWVGPHRNRVITVIVLVVILAIFVFFGYVQLRQKLGI